ncbi:pyridoxamine 5'-phosphate oxidase family protein [Nitriliruptoraceae bacterium ZYF776]|nr:pyridoxamine 5'-phosphate oxidase family protein [Profundirhabdus halotolerans]
MTIPTDRHGLEVLDLAQCLTLLRSRPLGRLAYVAAGVPHVVPVNHVVDGSTVVLRALEGSKLGALERRAAVAFQLDDHDAARGTGWSVLVQGWLEPVEGDVSRYADELDRWVGDDDAVTWMRVVPDTIAGRRLRRATGGQRSPEPGAAGPAD